MDEAGTLSAMSDLLTLKEAAGYLKVSRAQLYVLMASGRLRWVEVEGMRGRRVRRDDLDALLRDRRADTR
jgi:excisionase family DNA binding protein